MGQAGKPGGAALRIARVQRFPSIGFSIVRLHRGLPWLVPVHVLPVVHEDLSTVLVYTADITSTSLPLSQL